MDVSEVIRLENWLASKTVHVQSVYNELVKALKHNAEQANQMPITDIVKELSKALSDMPTQELSALQMRVLESLEIDNLIGKIGRKWLTKTIRAEVYDRATVAEKVQKASQDLSAAKSKLLAYRKAAKELGFSPDLPVDTPTPYLINVIFQGDVTIDNVRDWKKTANDWELIVSGVAAVAGEKPEEVKVVGTSNGSIIFTLSASPFFTKILATISKHISSIANDYLDFQLKREELERSRMMTKVIGDDLTRQEKARRTEGQASILEAVKVIAPNAEPEELGKLTKSVEKYLTFTENDGEVDFVSPPALDEEAEDYDETLAETVDELRGLIEEYRAEKQQTALLTYQDDADEEDDI